MSSIASSPVARGPNSKVMETIALRLREELASVKEASGRRIVRSADLLRLGPPSTAGRFQGNGMVATVPARTRAT